MKRKIIPLQSAFHLRFRVNVRSESGGRRRGRGGAALLGMWINKVNTAGMILRFYSELSGWILTPIVWGGGVLKTKLYI